MDSFHSRGQLEVSYYDRQYGKDETTGYSDVSVFAEPRPGSTRVVRATTSSMPPPTEFYGTKGGLFYGDYNWIATAGDYAYPIWSDTRGNDVFLCPGTASGPGNPPQLCTATEPNNVRANDQDIYTTRIVARDGEGR